MGFIDLNQLKAIEIFPGVNAKIVSGDRLMFSYVDMPANCEAALHNHPHEQWGIVLDGEFDFTIGSETRHLSAGDAYMIPSNIMHGAKTGKTGCRVLDVFSPPREDYKR